MPDLTDAVPHYGIQLDTLNARLLAIVDRIQEESATAPVIIIQGDHGGDLLENDARRMPILNAYYFPGETQGSLYPTISPIISFRLVFNEIFDANFKMLPDESYFSPPFEDLQYEWVEDPNPACRP